MATHSRFSIILTLILFSPALACANSTSLPTHSKHFTVLSAVLATGVASALARNYFLNLRKHRSQTNFLRIDFNDVCALQTSEQETYVMCSRHFSRIKSRLLKAVAGLRHRGGAKHPSWDSYYDITRSGQPPMGEQEPIMLGSSRDGLSLPTRNQSSDLKELLYANARRSEVESSGCYG